MMQTAIQPLPADHPLMVAWRAHQATLAEGDQSLWAAFFAGWEAMRSTIKGAQIVKDAEEQGDMAIAINPEEVLRLLDGVMVDVRDPAAVADLGKKEQPFGVVAELKAEGGRSA